MVLLAISGFSAGTDIYKQEIGCRLATPGLQGKVNEADRKQKELVTLKNKINLAWGPGKTYVLGKISWRSSLAFLRPNLFYLKSSSVKVVSTFFLYDKVVLKTHKN